MQSWLIIYRLHPLDFYGDSIFNQSNFDEIVYYELNISLTHCYVSKMDKSFFGLAVKPEWLLYIIN